MSWGARRSTVVGPAVVCEDGGAAAHQCDHLVSALMELTGDRAACLRVASVTSTRIYPSARVIPSGHACRTRARSLESLLARACLSRMRRACPNRRSPAAVRAELAGARPPVSRVGARAIKPRCSSCWICRVIVDWSTPHSSASSGWQELRLASGDRRPGRDNAHRPAIASVDLAWWTVATWSVGTSCTWPGWPGRASQAKVPARARPAAVCPQSRRQAGASRAANWSDQPDVGAPRSRVSLQSTMRLRSAKYHAPSIFEKMSR